MSSCSFCNAPLTTEFVDLGSSPPSNSNVAAADLDKPETVYPLKVYVCDSCFLVQIGEHKRATEIFSVDYPYFSSFSQYWLDHARKYCEMAVERFGLGPSSRVIEIASNDGYLLQYFQEKNIPVLGIEPAEGTANVARQKGIETLGAFFGTEFATELSKKNIQGDLVIGNNVLAHVPHINDLVGGLKISLRRGGTITMEFPHLLQLVENSQFDTIYHEHFSYLSLHTTTKIFAAHGLTIYDVEELGTHGGSLRIFAGHADEHPDISDNVIDLLEKESSLGMTSPEYYRGFQQKADKVRDDFVSFVRDAKAAGKTICAYGAAAKGNTLLNYCGIRADEIDLVADASPYKQGLFLPGSHIPIVALEKLKDAKPDYLVILPWNIKNEIAGQLNFIGEWGGKFVTAIPRLSTFSASNN